MAKWTQEEIDVLVDCYEKDMPVTDIIIALDGKRTVPAIRNKAKDLKITNAKLWTGDELKILKDAYENNITVKRIFELLDKKRSIESIRGKAESLNLFKYHFWTEEEEIILQKNYSNTYLYKLHEMLPNHTAGSITEKARKMGLTPFIFWSDEEVRYLKENWELLPDIVIAKKLNRTERAVSGKRKELRLLRRNRDKTNVKYLAKFFRANLAEWKKDSMKACNYKCIFSGSKDFDIHHLYSMHYIVEETLSSLGYDNNKLYTKDFPDDELNTLLSQFKIIHSKYPLGICVSPKIHQLYHRLYGTNNFPEQWEKFSKDYLNGIYDDFESTVCTDDEDFEERRA